MPSIFKIFGEAQFRGDATGSGNALTVADSSGTTRFTVANTGRFTLGQDAGSTISTAATITTDVAGAFLVLRPNGNGGIIAGVPDNTLTGGNARGNNSVDLQSVRSANIQVASGNASVICGGERNTASGNNAVVVGGFGNTCSNQWSGVLGGNSNIASGDRSTVGAGSSNTASGAFSTVGGGIGNTAATSGSFVVGYSNSANTENYTSVAGGRDAGASIYGQTAYSSGIFTNTSDAQTSNIRFRRSVTGFSITEMLLDGGVDGTKRAVLNLAPNARAWRGRLDLIAIITVAGTASGVLVNDTFSISYDFCIKRTGAAATTVLVGSPVAVNQLSDASMSTSVVTITANTTNGALKLEFTPPTTAVADTVTRVMATAYLTEVGR